MLHIAQPENVEAWLAAATAAGVTDFDVIGISYYPKWSKNTLAGLGATINRSALSLSATPRSWWRKPPIPGRWPGRTASSNQMGEDDLMPAYRATPEGQQQYLIDLTQTRDRQWRLGRHLLGAGLGFHGLPHALGPGLQLGERHVLRFRRQCAAGHRFHAAQVQLIRHRRTELALKARMLLAAPRRSGPQASRFAGRAPPPRC